MSNNPRYDQPLDPAIEAKARELLTTYGENKSHADLAKADADTAKDALKDLLDANALRALTLAGIGTVYYTDDGKPTQAWDDSELDTLVEFIANSQDQDMTCARFLELLLGCKVAKPGKKGSFNIRLAKPEDTKPKAAGAKAPSPRKVAKAKKE